MSELARIILPALAAGALLVAGCGDDDTTTASSTPAATANSVDRAFIRDMVPHHEAAVAMAKIAEERGSSEFVKNLAGDIVQSQTEEIATMRARDRELAAAGVALGSLGLSDEAMGMDHDMSSLESARPFDAAFLRMMIPHHEGALVMSNAVLRRGRDPEIAQLARSIILAQRKEIAAMKLKLKDGGGDAMHDGDYMPGHSG